MAWLIAGIVVSLLIMFVTADLARRKGYDYNSGCLNGCMFSIFGLLFYLLKPDLTKNPPGGD